MNLLYVAVDPALYTHYLAGETYPARQYPFPNYVDEVPNFTTCSNNNDRAAAKIIHTIALKTQNAIVNMNTALSHTLLSLIPMAFKILYKQEWMMDPNAVFRQCFNWFVIKYGRTLAEDRKTNRTAMAADWHPSMGLKYSPHTYSMVLHSQDSLDIQSPTRTPLTLASAYSIAQASLPKNIRHGSSVVTMPAKPMTSQLSSHSWKIQSTLQRLPQSL
jgi:hypothetical protein